MCRDRSARHPTVRERHAGWIDDVREDANGSCANLYLLHGEGLSEDDGMAPAGPQDPQSLRSAIRLERGIPPASAAASEARPGTAAFRRRARRTRDLLTPA